MLCSTIECAIGGLQKVANSRAVVTLFDSAWLLWILMMIHLKSMLNAQFIILSLLCSTIECAICYLTIIQPSWDLIRSLEISQDLLRSHKIYWGPIRSTEISSINWFDILHLIFDTWHLTFDIDMPLTLICCEIWQLIFDIQIDWHDTL